MASRKLHQQIFGQHDHRQTFAAALRMPDDAALPVAFFIRLLDGFDNLLDGKILLIAADFFHIGIKQHKVVDQLHHTGRGEKRNQVAVLLGGNAVMDIPGEGIFQKVSILLFPHGPEFFWRACGGIFYAVFVGGQYNLGKLVQLGNVFFLLVTDVLFHRLLYADLRCLALDDGKGNAIDKQNQIRSGVVQLITAVNGEFFGYMEQIVFRMLPVDIPQVEAENFPFAHGLGVAFAQKQRIVDLFTGAHQTICERFVQIVHGTFNVGSGKFIFRTGKGVPVQTAQLSAQNVFQQHMVPAAALRVAVLRGNIGIPHGLQQIERGLLAGSLFAIQIGCDGKIRHGWSPFSQMTSLNCRCCIVKSSLCKARCEDKSMVMVESSICASVRMY